ncbi:uncharacterized protein Z520_01008 [Fonsecaea multimorphosa CBS 102226]|uniref:Zn(2)-C6 fungal-type domain-containing protein n=1 Tax=Fonsecaea multimorphosa CBS 102226 TaxID=1442371 RepID=A0A0D2K8Z2_9EURO|nr:uncharacterized protein Z520_01008 [Fonsecaea multimorphosa CBS 102226]KIY02543.1 hypothetical protein Z520_01008 [Fonsecaea multimorphosa CBS 102226]OAL31410.1 hypothetical protein AYO22_01002 [Fonsecaea multimorphosa]
MARTTKISQAPVSTSAGDDANVRKRRAHKKSRLGCRNCKIRRVKCNEVRPMCGKCLEYGVLCNYDPSIPDLQPRTVASELGCLHSRMEKSPLGTTKPVLDMVNVSLNRNTDGPELCRIDKSDLARLDRFQSRTVLTIGTKKVARVFQHETISIACSQPFLMHLAQAVTASHDRYLCGRATSRPSTAEAYHLNKALVAFQSILSRPIKQGEGDALIVASSLLGVVSFFNLEASSVEDVWPLQDTDMAWLNLSEGKHAIWRLATPLKGDSLWRKVAYLFDCEKLPEDQFPEHTPSIFDHLCAEDPSSPSARSNPYYKTAQQLLPLLDLECNDATWLMFLGFVSQMDPRYKSLLAQKDPWALLMLLYWYMKVCRSAWWVSSRSILQGHAICLYLTRYHSHDRTIVAALEKPSMAFETARLEGFGGISSAVSSPGWS